MYNQSIITTVHESIGSHAAIDSGNQDIMHFLSTANQWKPLANELKLVNSNNFFRFNDLIHRQNRIVLMNDNDHQWEYLATVLKYVIKYHIWHINKEGQHATAAEYFMAVLFHSSGNGLTPDNRIITPVDYFKKVYEIFPYNWKGVSNIKRITDMCQCVHLPHPLPKDLPTYVRLFGLSTNMAVGKKMLH